MSEQTPSQLFDAARAAEREGQQDEAIRLYRKVIEADASSFEAAAARRNLARLNGEEIAAGSTSLDAAQAGEVNDYATGRAVASLIAFIGWVLVALGAIGMLVAFGAFSQSGGFRYGPGFPGLIAVLLIPGGVVITGLFAVLGGQAARALFDTALASRRVAALLARRD